MGFQELAPRLDSTISRSSAKDIPDFQSFSPSQSNLSAIFAEQVIQAPSSIVPEYTVGISNENQLNTESALKTESAFQKVADSLNAQLNLVQPKEIEKIISDFGDRQDLARSSLHAMTQFASLESWGDLAKQMSELGDRGQEIYTHGTATASDALSYLANQKKLWDESGMFKTTSQIKPNSIVILDEAMLQHLEKDKDFQDQVIRAQPTLVIPDGLSTGINPFNAPNLESIRDKLSNFVNHSTQNEEARASIEGYTSLALNQDVLSRVGKISPSLSEHCVVAHNPNYEDRDLSDTALATRLNGTKQFSAEILDQSFGDLPKPHQEMAADLLQSEAHVYSHRSLAALGSDLLPELKEQLQQQGTALSEAVFVNLHADKSYSIAGYIAHQSSGGEISPDQFISYDDFKRQAARGELKDKTVVSIDDMTLSGEQNDRAREIIGKHFKGNVVLGRFISSERGAYNNEFAGRTNPNFGAADGSLVADTNKFADSLNPIQRAVYEDLKGQAGFKDTATLIATPYMSPDNNCQFFREAIAPSVVLNPNAVQKLITGLKWESPTAESLETRLQECEKSVFASCIDGSNVPIQTLHLLETVDGIKSMRASLGTLNADQQADLSVLHDMVEAAGHKGLSEYIGAVQKDPDALKGIQAGANLAFAAELSNYPGNEEFLPQIARFVAKYATAENLKLAADLLKAEGDKLDPRFKSFLRSILGAVSD